MKMRTKILSIVLALIMMLGTASIAASAFTNNASNANITIYPDTDYGVSGISDITFMELSEDTLTGITPGSGYVIRSAPGADNAQNPTVGTQYYIESYNNVSLASPYESPYSSYYRNSNGVYNNVCTVHYANVGTLDGRSIDVDLHVDQLNVTGGMTNQNGLTFLFTTNEVTMSRASVYLGNDIPLNIYTQNEEHFTITIKYHDDGTVVTGSRFILSVSDIDYGYSYRFPLREAFTSGQGFTNDYWIFSSCFLYNENVGNYVKWTAPNNSYEGANGVTGNASFTKAGVYALTNGEGSFSFTLCGMSYGTNISVSTEVSKVTRSYSVTYNANGARFADTKVQKSDPDMHEESDTVTVYGSGNDGFVPTYSGHVFSGWNTEPDGSGTSYGAGDTFRMPAEDVTLYAQWDLLKYRLKFVNDQEGSSKIVYYTTDVDYSGTYTLQSQLPVANNANIEDGIPKLPDGQVFAGWFTTKAASQYGGNNHVSPSLAFAKTFRAANYVSNDTDADGTRIVYLYAGAVKAGTVQKDGSDVYGYGTSTLGGFELEGVQIRGKDILESYTIMEPERNVQYDGLRFLTTYSKSFMDEVMGLGSTLNKSFKYGYAIARPDQVQNSTSALKIGKSNVFDVDCTKEIAEWNHRNFNDYILSTVVIKYETAAEQAHLNDNVLARSYVKYVDANGFSRYGYDIYTGSQNHGGGCYTSFNNAVSHCISGGK